MAYVRRHGNQLALVQGERDPETSKVNQRVLFTIYSKREARLILGETNLNNTPDFEVLLCDQYPLIRFNWKKIRKAISDNIDFLPDIYEYKRARLQGRFRNDLQKFAKQLIITDPQELLASAKLIGENQFELEFLHELIEWRLQMRKQKESQWNQDNEFFWRYALHDADVPPGIEEMAETYFDRGELEKAESIFRLLVDCFEDYADGYNYLGLICREQCKLEETIEYFRKCVELGRCRFPKRIARGLYWDHLSTRPYMRGKMNLAETLNETGQFDEALNLLDEMDSEWGQRNWSAWHRATIYLNMGEWSDALKLAENIDDFGASQSILASISYFELGKLKNALETFVHAATNLPLATKMLFGKRNKKVPTSFTHIEDHNTGVSLGRSLIGYHLTQSQSSKRFFKKLISDPRISSLIREAESLDQKIDQERSIDEKKAFDRLHQIQSLDFAKVQAEKLIDLTR